MFRHELDEFKIYSEYLLKSINTYESVKHCRHNLLNKHYNCLQAKTFLLSVMNI